MNALIFLRGNLEYKIVRSFEPEIVLGHKVTRHVIEYMNAISYMCEIEMDGKTYMEKQSWHSSTNEDAVIKLQRKIIYEALGLR